MRGASVVVLAACGRVGFDAVPDRDGPIGDPADAFVDCGPATFCDGFEDPALAVWTGTETTGGSTIVRDGAFGYRGASLHATSPAGGDIAVRSVDVFATVQTEIWVRAFIYAPSGFELDLEPVELTDPATSHQLVMSLYTDGADVHSHNFGTDFMLDSTVATPRDRWVCYEMQVVLGSPGSIVLYQDGTALLAAPSMNVVPPNNDLRRTRVGIASKPTTLGENLFVDNVAVGTTRIACN